MNCFLLLVISILLQESHSLVAIRITPYLKCSDISLSKSKLNSVNDLKDKIAEETINVSSNPKDTFSILQREKLKSQVKTFLRVGIPSLIFGIVSFLVFPYISLGLASLVNDRTVLQDVLSIDSTQFTQNYVTVVGLLFSILAGQTYYFMYQQQESVYVALFKEVSEAKSLLEQVALVCQGRRMYPTVLNSINRYVQDDLKQLQADPAKLLSSRPIDDPLESIMYMTSVGVPSSIYQTVRSLRQARADRLGALQRKLPKLHNLMLWILAVMELMSFPILGAGTETIGGFRNLTVEGVLFGIAATGVAMTLNVIEEMYRPTGGAYNVDNVLNVMVSGLDNELSMRMKNVYQSQKSSTTPQYYDKAKITKPVQEVEILQKSNKNSITTRAKKMLRYCSSWLFTKNNKII